MLPFRCFRPVINSLWCGVWLLCGTALLPAADAPAKSPAAAGRKPVAAPPPPILAPLAVEFARREHTWWQESLETAGKAVKVAEQAVAARQQEAAAAQQQIADGMAALKTAEVTVARAQQELAAAKKQQAVLEKSLKDSGAKVADGELTNAADLEPATKQAARKQLAELAAIEQQLVELQQQIDGGPAAIKAAKALAATGTKALAATVKPIAAAQAALKAANTQTAPVRKSAGEAAARLARLQGGLPLVDAKAARLVGTWKHNRPMISCRVTPDGLHVIGGAQDAELHRFHLLSGESTPLAGHRSWVRRFAVQGTGDGSLLVSGAYAGKLIWWDPASDAPAPVRQVQAHQGFVRGVAINPAGTLVASCGNDLVVRVWSAAEGELLHELTGHTRHVYNLAFSPDGTALVSGDLMGVLKHWDTATWEEVRELDAKILAKYDKTFRADIGGIRGMDFSPDGSRVVVCGISKVSNAFAGIGVPTAVLLDFATGKQLAVMQPAKSFKGTMWSVRFHPSGRFLAGVGGSGSGMMWFWKTGEAKSYHELKLPGTGYDLDFHPDGLRLCVAQYAKALNLYDLGPAPPAAKKQPAKKKK